MAPSTMAQEMAEKFSFRKEILNIPNMLTIGRVLIIPVVLYYLAQDTPRSSVIAMILFSAASITDAVDGWLARKWKIITRTGKFLDPLADKLLVMAILIMMVPMGRIDAWVVILLLAREITITALRSFAADEHIIIGADTGGKIKAALQMVGILFLCLHFKYPLELIWFHPVIDYHVVGYWMILVSLGFSLTSALGYFKALYGPSESSA
jgi:CDP-diacylglycerol--glycerol-3-phosphate 3-phosphatidyltransferase